MGTRMMSHVLAGRKVVMEETVEEEDILYAVSSLL